MRTSNIEFAKTRMSYYMLNTLSDVFVCCLPSFDQNAGGCAFDVKLHIFRYDERVVMQHASTNDTLLVRGVHKRFLSL